MIMRTFSSSAEFFFYFVGEELEDGNFEGRGTKGQLLALQLQKKSSGCSSVHNMRRNARSCSFGCSFLFFSFEKENILGAGRSF